MDKKILALILVILIIAIILGVKIYTDKNKTTSNKVDSNLSSTNKDQENVNTNKNILVVYYSAQNHTKAVANKIAKNLNADTFEIVPKEVYTENDLDWTDSNSRVSKEYNDESLRNVELVTNEVENFEKYDTILIGYPIWWGIAAWPVNTFIKENNFEGKTVIPFCTSASSGLGQSGKLLQKEAGSGNWLDGKRFSSNPSDQDIKKWTDSLINL